MKTRIVALVAIAASGCQYDPHAGKYTTYAPSTEEITGDYELENVFMETYASGIGEKVAKLATPPMIRLLADGNFIAEQFPYFSETSGQFDYKFEGFRTVHGKWTPTTVGSIGDGSGTTKSHYGIVVDGMPTHLAYFGFTGVSKVEGLIIGFGDPDAGDAIMFKKKIGSVSAHP